MSNVKEATFWKKREDRPPEVEEMADFFTANGWTLVEEWLDPWHDEEEDIEYEGKWSYTLIHEEMIDDRLHMWQMFPIEPTSWKEAWEHTLKLATMGWERYKEGIDG